MIKLDKNNFKESIHNGVKLVEFSAPWCGHCKAQEPILEEITDFWIGQVDADNSPEILQQYGIKLLPSFILFDNGQEVERLTGFHQKVDILEKLLGYMNKERNDSYQESREAILDVEADEDF